MKKKEFVKLIEMVASQHNIDINYAYDTVRFALEKAFSGYYGYDVSICFDENGIVLKGYPLINNVPTEVGLSISKLKKSSVFEIINDVKQYFNVLSATEALRYLQNIYRNIIQGKIYKIINNTIIVETNYTDKAVLFQFPKSMQIKSERKTYYVGKELYFYVSSITLENTNGIYRACVQLSRTSIQLPALLIKTFINQSISIKCEYRISGVISRLKSSVKIPKHIILDVSKELNGERIKINYGNKNVI